MAKIIEPLNNQELNLQEDEELVNLFAELKTEEESQAAQAEQEPEVTATQEPENDVPNKYQGKSIEEIVQMHQEAEKLVGRQSSEVGELRKIVDDFIKTKADETKQEVPDNSSVDDLDFFENPNEAVSKAVSNSSEMKQMKELLAKTKQQEILSQLQSQHPDYVDVIKDDEFANWVKASEVRIELLQRADSYDLNAANELLSNWKQIQGVKQVSQQDRKQQIKAASTGGKGSGEPTSRKIYKRTDIVQLMISDPDRYKANVEEFDKAYREGRVK